jgi:hypothetical protein
MNFFSKIKNRFKKTKKLSKLQTSLLIFSVVLILVSFVPVIKYQVDRLNLPSQPSKEEQFKQAQKYNFVVYKYDFKGTRPVKI